MVRQSSEQSLRLALRNELLGPPRRTRAAQYSLVSFGALTVVSLMIQAFSDIEVHAGTTLVGIGFMTWCGFSELLAPDQRRLTIGLRFSGIIIVMLGFLTLLR
ncbi:MAG TPA: hypothetical protein VK086_04020 [Ruania sp.]|nr:hypothetical protein [Ruania sp.]